jgi:hypothetical protein
MKLQLQCLCFDYIGKEPFKDFLLSEEDAKWLIAKDPNVLPSFFIAVSDFKPGQTIRIGQTGYDLMIVQYSFSGQIAGHSHGGTYNAGLPNEVRFTSGQYNNYTLGEACGMVTEKVTVYSGGQTGSATGQARVIIPGLVGLSSAPCIKLIGSTADHPINHFGTTDTNSKILALANEYYGKEKKPLYINDMSLIWGGLFDISGTYSPPHHEHTNGTSVDIAATKNALTNEKLFIEILRRYTTNYILEYDTDPTKRHYHVRF